MKTKKRLEIKTFNNFSNINNIQVHNFYNYKNNTKLEVSNGISNPKLRYSPDDAREYSLKLEEAGIQKVEGLNCIKQYFPNSKKTVYRLLIYANDNKLYFNQLLNYTGDVFDLYQLQFSSAPSVLGYKKDDSDITILADKEKMVFYKVNMLPYEVADLPIITSICLNDDYMYCTLEDPAYKIWYTKSKDIEIVGTTDNLSGFISLDDELGDARKVAVLDKEVYVFRDYGISKITQIKGEIQISNVYSSNSRIFPNTVCVSGEEALFMTQEGIYRFNGYRVSKCNLNFEHLKISGLNANGGSLGDKYYLAVRIDFNDDLKILCEQGDFVNNALIIIDVNTSSYQLIRGVDIKSFLPVKTDVYEKILMVFNSGNNGIGEIVDESVFFNENLPKYWISENLFNDTDAKLFTKLSVNAEKDVKIKLVHDDKTTTFSTYKTGTNEFTFKIYAKQLKIEISSILSNADVDSVCLDYYVYWYKFTKKI